MSEVFHVEITGDSTSLKKASAEGATSLGSIGKVGGAVMTRLGQLGKATAVFGIAVAVAAGHLSIDFNQAMELSHTQAGATAKEVSNLSGKVLELSKHSEFAPTELANGLYRVESAGIRGSKALKTLDDAQKLAAVGQSDLQTTTYALVAAMNSGIKGTETSAKTVGVLNAAVGEGNMRMDDLTGALGTGVLPAAKAFGLSLKDVTSAIDVMTRSGTPATAAATRLRMTFSLMAAPTSKATSALGDIGLKQDDLAKDMRKPDGLVRAVTDLHDHLDGLSKVKQAQTISSIFGGGRTSAGILTLVGNVDQLGKIYDETGQKAGQFGKDVASQMEQPGARLKVAENQIQVALIQLGDTFTGPVASAVEQFTTAITNPNLTRDERISKAAELISTDVTKAIPVIAHAGEEAAIGLGKGFIAGWSHENPVTKILTIAALTRLIGGKGAVVGAGKLIGSWLGIGIAEGEATTATGGALLGGAGGAGGKVAAAEGGAARGEGGLMAGLVGAAGGMSFGGGSKAAQIGEKMGGTKIGGALGTLIGGSAAASTADTLATKAKGLLGNVRWARVGALGIGLTMADTIMGEMSNEMQQKSPDLLTNLTATIPKNSDGKILGVGVEDVFGSSDTSKAGQGLVDVVKKLSAGYVDLTASERQAIDQGEKFGGFSTTQIKAVNNLVNANDTVINSLKNGMKELNSGTFTNMADINKVSTRNQALITKIYAGDPNAIRSASADNMRAVAANIKAGMKAGEINTAEGAQKIKELLRTANLTEGLTPGTFGATFAKGFANAKVITKAGIRGVITDLKTMPPQAQQVAFQTMMNMLRTFEQQGKLTTKQFKQIRSNILAEIDGIHDDAPPKINKAVKVMTSAFAGLKSGIGGILSQISQGVNNALSSLGGDGVSFNLGPLSGIASGLANAFGALVGGGKGKNNKQAGGVITSNVHREGFPVRGVGSGDKVPALLEPGEVVWNKKAVAAMGGPRMANAPNHQVQRFKHGGTVRIGGKGAAHGLGQGTYDKVSAAALEYLKREKKKLQPQGGGGASKGPDGVGSYQGIPMANWVIDALQHAAQKGAAPHPTSGWRSASEVVHSSVVAPQGHSEHQGTKYPHGAVDFGSPTGGPAVVAAKMSVVNATQGYKYPLLAPAGFRDDGHASGTGHQRGGIIRLAKGGWVRVGATYEGLDGHQGSYGTVGGVNFAELLVAGQNAGLRSQDLAATLGLPNGQYGLKGGQKLHFRLPGGKKDVVASKNDNGSGQGGDPHYKVDVQTGLMRALGWHEGSDLLVSVAGGSAGGKKSAKHQKQIAKGKKLGLSAKVQAQVANLQAQADEYAEYADRADQLSAEGTVTPVKGLTEVQWLHRELDTLFRLRNVLIVAAQAVVQKREDTENKIGKLTTEQTALKAIKKPTKTQKARMKQIDAVLPKLKQQVSDINSKHGDLFTSIETVQGKGSSMKPLGSLPPIDQMGGQIFDVRMAIQGLEGGSATATDNSDLLGIVQQQNIDLAKDNGVLARQYPILAQIPQLIGAFAKGGTIPAGGGYALLGEEGMEIAKLPGGTQVSNNRESMAMLGNMAADRRDGGSEEADMYVAEVALHGDLHTDGRPLEDAVEVKIEKKQRKDASKARRRQTRRPR